MRAAGSPAILSLIVGLLALGGCVYALATAARTSSASPQAQAGTALSTADCIEVDRNDSARVSINIDNSPELFAFEVYFAYDPDLLEVIDRDVRLFLSEGPNSSVLDVSDPVPNSTGIYRLGAADVALGGTAETGDGTLATVTVRAKAEGVSPAAIYRSSDFIGPKLTTVGGGKIGDTNGDDIFDGPIASGQVAIDVSCNPVAPTLRPDIVPTPTATPSSSGGAASPGSTSATDQTDGPTDGPSNGGGTAGTGESPAATSTVDASSPAGETADPSASNGPSLSPPVSDDPGSDSGPNNTLWAVVLTSAGVAGGLVITYVFARMTRKPA